MSTIARICLAAWICFAAGQATAAVPEPQSAPVEKRIPYKNTNESGAGALALRAVVSLTAVLLIGVGVIVAIRKYVPMVRSAGPRTGSRWIEIVEHRRLTPRLTVFLIEVQGARYLLAQSGDQLTQLSPTPPKE